MKKVYLLYILCALLPILASMCANPGTPKGGPKDKRPPLVVNSKPLPFSTGFEGKNVQIFFDENIQVKDADQKFVMSPPVFPAPKVDAHGKILSVRLDDKVELMPNTTYTLDFSDCVSDLNEGNKIENFAFTFSTGESQDSMMISGNLYDAQTLDPLKGVYVVLHSNLEDSALHTISPIRISKTDEMGRFVIRNVPAESEYMVYALDDQNRNFLYDQKGLEKVARCAVPVVPSWEIRQIADSIPIDSLCFSRDTSEWVFEHIMRDTLVYTPDSLKLFAYSEKAYDQYIEKDSRSERNRIDLVFHNRMETKPQIAFVGHEDSDKKAVLEHSLYNDSLAVWMTDTLIYDKDSVVMAISYPVLDTLGQMVMKVDTMEFWHFNKKADPKEEKRKSKKDKGKTATVEKKPVLDLQIPQSMGAFGMLTIKSKTPYKDINWEGITLYHKRDTIFDPMEYTVHKDTIDLKIVRLKAKWQPGEAYKLSVDSASVVDIYEVANDKKEYNVTTPAMDKYGTLYIETDSVFDNALLQLVNSKGDVMRQNYVPKNGKVAFRYLKPSEYMIRILKDENKNGKFDNGSFDEKIQPEEFIYYMEKVQVRANWDIKVDFSLKNFSVDKFVQKFKAKKKGNGKRR